MTDYTGTILMTAADYDRHLLTNARELSQLHDVTAMRLWLAAHGDEMSEHPMAETVYAYVLGCAQSTLGELVRWLDRIPEANRD